MAISYNGLWKQLIDERLKKKVIYDSKSGVVEEEHRKLM